MDIPEALEWLVWDVTEDEFVCACATPADAQCVVEAMNAAYENKYEVRKRTG